MNQIYLYPEDFESKKDFLIKDQNRLNHLQNNLKVEIGKKYNFFIPNKGRYQATIEQIQSKKQIQGKILQPLPTLDFPSVHLIIGISRPQTLKKIIEHGASMGVTHFHFVQMVLSDKSFLKSKIFHENKINALIDLGLAQSNCYWKRPQIFLYEKLSTAIQCIHNHNKNTAKAILSPQADKNLSQAQIISNPNISSCYILGPERGFVKSEEELAIKNNFIAIKISPSILRVENAVMSILGQEYLVRGL